MRNCLLEKKWVIRVCGDPAGAGNRVVQGFHFFPKGNIRFAVISSNAALNSFP